MRFKAYELLLCPHKRYAVHLHVSLFHEFMCKYKYVNKINCLIILFTRLDAPMHTKTVLAQDKLFVINSKVHWLVTRWKKRKYWFLFLIFMIQLTKLITENYVTDYSEKRSSVILFCLQKIIDTLCEIQCLIISHEVLKKRKDKNFKIGIIFVEVCDITYICFPEEPFSSC